MITIAWVISTGSPASDGLMKISLLTGRKWDCDSVWHEEIMSVIQNEQFWLFSSKQKYVIGSGGVNTVLKTLSASENVQRLKHEGVTTVASDDFKKTCQGNMSMSWYTRVTEQKRWRFIQPGVGISVSASTWIQWKRKQKSNCSIFVDKLCIFLWTLESVNGGQSLFAV